MRRPAFELRARDLQPEEKEALRRRLTPVAPERSRWPWAALVLLGVLLWAAVPRQPASVVVTLPEEPSSMEPMHALEPVALEVPAAVLEVATSTGWDHDWPSEPAPERLMPVEVSPVTMHLGLQRLPVPGVLTSTFGWRVHPIRRTRRHHDGIDIAAPTGTVVGATAPGVVVFAGERGGYGNCVTVQHIGGLSARYAHLHRIHVSVGEMVDVGQTLGLVGTTGASTGPHLHYEVRQDDRPVDPAAFHADLP